jgi:molybdopterin-containing oxidoreductase family iron-sulfur binding subunit
VRFLTDSVGGPAAREAIAAFLSRYRDGRHVTYDPISTSAIADAHLATHGARIVPRYRFDQAQTIVALGADFLGPWISPMEHTAGYRAGRQVEQGAERFSHHVQFESRMTLSGSNADRRVAVPAGAMTLIAAWLANELADLSRSPTPWHSLPACPIDAPEIAALAKKLWDSPRGKTLVVCGENDVTAQKLTNFANHLLGNYGAAAAGTTLDLEGVSTRRHGDDGQLRKLLDEIETGAVDALFVRGVNPLYDLPAGERLARAMEKVQLVVSFAEQENETTRQAGFVCPEPHFLESWGDAEPRAGLVSIRQPTLRRIGSTRPLLESLAAWSGKRAKAYDLLRASWRQNVFPRRAADAASTFDAFWNRALHDGFVRLSEPGMPDGLRRFEMSAVTAPAAWSTTGSDEFVLDLHPSAGMLDGRHAHNPWLHELPDPIAKTVWDNFAAFSPAAAASLGLTGGDVVRVTTGDEDLSVELPVLVQPGQHERCVAIALGYGRQGTDRFAEVGPQWLEGRPTLVKGETIGTSAAPLLDWVDGTLSYGGRRVRVEKTGRRHELVATQLHHSLEMPAKLVMGRDTERHIAQETTLAAWRRDPGAGGGHGHHDLPSLWPDHPKSPHHWGLAIDLTACTGCSACVIACQAENNIPVVGKDEVRRAREMHWMRIDRYYSGEGSDVDVVHMPMMCQHCDNAPCETVCPVQATVQSAEGLNQQVYNRCVGTRYCANNCPYKVRRFNWFDYPHEEPLENLTLNPDVTVRSRGVMEKCSLCVQRIQDAKSESKQSGLPIADGEIQPACVQSCPAGAIVFGDMNDPESKLSHHKHDPRHFVVLEELGVKPVVGYLTLVRNREDA